MIPSSFAKDGFTIPVKRKYRRLLLGTEGAANTGKTEFILSAPGPGIVIPLDRNYEPTLDNPTPPASRCNDYVFFPLEIPLVGGADQKEYERYWITFRDATYRAVKNADVRTVAIDGDSDSWELQRLAAFGKLTQVPSILYTGVNAARRLFIARLHDSGKIIIATNKLKKQYKPLKNDDGTAVLDDAGRPKREWDGKSYERQGFDDHEYLWHIQIRHLYDEGTKRFGLRILMAKANRALEGEELWGEDCNFASLVQVVYPQIPLSEWGYK